jgi:RNA polymerase sigma-70 factor (ECF subfamily)
LLHEQLASDLAAGPILHFVFRFPSKNHHQRQLPDEPLGLPDRDSPMVRTDNPERDCGEGVAHPAKSTVFLPLFLKNERRLYAYILTLLPHRADADDVLQEVSLVLWDKFDEQNPPGDFAAWACRIAYFKVLDFYKKRQRSRVRFSQAMLDRVAETAVEQAGVLQLDARSEALSACLEKLSFKDRDLLGRRFAEGSTTQSTAAALGRSVEALYKALARIRQSLFECVTRSLAQEGHS